MIILSVYLLFSCEFTDWQSQTQRWIKKNQAQSEVFVEWCLSFSDLFVVWEIDFFMDPWNIHEVMKIIFLLLFSKMTEYFYEKGLWYMSLSWQYKKMFSYRMLYLIWDTLLLKRSCEIRKVSYILVAVAQILYWKMKTNRNLKTDDLKYFLCWFNLRLWKKSNTSTQLSQV